MNESGERRYEVPNEEEIFWNSIWNIEKKGNEDADWLSDLKSENFPIF